jgi:hypothetical protein
MLAACLDTEGDEGFEALLLELAPYLRWPFVVHMVEAFFDDAPGSAQQWCVRPGAQAVEYRTFSQQKEQPDKPQQSPAAPAAAAPAAAPTAQ